MGAKQLRIAPIRPAVAVAFVKRHHYSGKVVNNSKVHLGVFFGDRLSGCLQFGPPLDKRRVLPLVEGTNWGGMIELNRMAMIEDTPRNAESRAIAVACRLLAEQYPQLEWVLSFADGTQCGDGMIYRASGFVLTGIKKNTQIWSNGADRLSRATATDTRRISRTTMTKGSHIIQAHGRSDGAKSTGTGAASMKVWRERGYAPLPGFQLRYIKFLRAGVRERLAVPEIPFSRIAEMGAAMYKGEPICA